MNRAGHVTEESVERTIATVDVDVVHIGRHPLAGVRVMARSSEAELVGCHLPLTQAQIAAIARFLRSPGCRVTARLVIQATGDPRAE